METNNIEHKKKLLKENYGPVPRNITFNEWLAAELRYNPTMGRWLTDNDDLPDYYLTNDYEKLFDEEDIKHIEE